MKMNYTLKKVMPVIACLFLLTNAGAQHFKLLKDIDSLKSSRRAQITYAPFAVLNGKTFFAADDGIHGSELWSSDGTESGTNMVADLIPGTGSSAPANITLFKNKIFFAAKDAGTGLFKLWVTDGTAAGTKMIKENTNGGVIDKPFYFIVVNNVLYFTISRSLLNEDDWRTDGDNIFTQANGTELWRTDGTNAGTRLVINFNTAEYDYNAYMWDLADCHGKLCFLSYGSGRSYIWMTDGTKEGTKAVIKTTSYVTKLTSLNDSLYYASYGDGGTLTLWRYSDYDSSKAQVAGNNALSMDGSFDYEAFCTKGNNLYFRAIDYNNLANGYNLYIYNVTKPGHVTLLKTNIAESMRLYSVGEYVYFAYQTASLNWQLWRTDTSAASTLLLNDEGSLGGNYPLFFNVNNTLFFTHSNITAGLELWRSDGTVTGTKMMKDIWPGFYGATPGCLTYTGSDILFYANDGVTGSELWHTDGTPENTGLVKNINNIASDNAHTVYGVPSMALDSSHLFFVATDGRYNNGLWKTDGTKNGTVQVRDAQNNFVANVRYLFGAPFRKNLYYFSGTTDGLTTLSKTDGIPAHTTTFPGSLPNPFYVMSMQGGDSLLYFGLLNIKGIYGYFQLWGTNGLDAPKFLADFGSILDPNSLAVLNNDAYFVRFNNTTPELWKSNGLSGVAKVKEITAGSGNNPSNNVFANNNRVYFSMTDGPGNNLWISDGTANGTVMLKQVEVLNEVAFAALKTKTVFVGSDGIHGMELWITDGTAVGTMMVKDINNGVTPSNPENFVAVNGELFFTANDGVNPNALWKSDGTETGTMMVKSFAAYNNALPASIINANGELYFTINGNLWQSDGTDVGTHAVTDDYLQNVSNITDVMAVSNKVIVAGYTYLNGAEFFTSDAQPALPVTLLSFNGELIKKDAALNWQTTNEINNSHFNVQRSTGSAFVSIGKVNAANNVAVVERYTYTDTDVVALGVGTLYYRLQQVDKDGKIAYSNVIKLKTGINDDIIILPNPAHKIAFVRSPVNIGNALITITDAGGHIVYTSRENIQASVPIPLNVSALANGTYIVTIQARGINRQSRLILQ